METRQAVAEEIRAVMGRKRISGSELARRLDRSQPWVSRRISGAVALDWDDMDRIAQALDVAISDLLPGDLRTGSGLTLLPGDPQQELPFPGVRRELAVV